jgi:5-methylcytosine-specific restriction endonuclease McrA
MRRCSQCREKFITLDRRGKYCSRECYYASLKVPLEEVYRRDRGVCHLCGRWVRFEDASRDHLRPRSLGGPTTWKNIKLAHKKCNSRRSSRPVKEFQEEVIYASRSVSAVSQ